MSSTKTEDRILEKYKHMCFYEYLFSRILLFLFVVILAATAWLTQ